MTKYYRPVVRFGEMPTSQSFPLAGGLCWFDTVAVHTRGSRVRSVPAGDVPAEILENLTRARPPIAGMAMTGPRIMGILNVTPDSFSDGGQFNAPELALAHAQAMQEEGADIIDVGGESTRPGAAEVQIAAEIARTAPVIAAIRAQSNVPISIDTRKSDVGLAAVEAGATLINDVAAFTFDTKLAAVAAEAKVPVCVMHAKGSPETMQNDPTYDDVLLDVYDFLSARIAAAVAAGIARDQIVVDPGIGFGKTLEHNLTLLRGIALFHALGCPVLLGASRKRFIGTIGGGTDASDRVSGSVAVALFAARRGVQILRVHDIFATKQALDLEWAIGGAAIT
ncbi:dihydropteroate synthase [Loktanella sp. 5RATIMAR09]|uniref:dihydropteroate synthase n=1 Tax=Loktanella sp. 5RATIMAR09 TaxID=1225655 RepID=UPI0006EBCF49|nr:dihydropteroate synthase [Loktanella sp. 5RATIMAR09]KQI70653.1 dihydropteroate synthase [Loktanella sp. 5RATIMAR09]